jgi:hypothetical protein
MCAGHKMRSEGEKYRAYARECLRLAERPTMPEVWEKLIALARVWKDAAMNEERLLRRKEDRGA